MPRLRCYRVLAPRRVVGACVLGGLCTVGVAWGCALFSYAGEAVHDDAAFESRRVSAVHSAPPAWPADAPSDWGFAPDYAHRYVGFGMHHATYSATAPAGVAFDDALYAETTAGWPFPALRSVYANEGTHTHTTQHGGHTIQHGTVRQRTPAGLLGIVAHGLPGAMFPQSLVFQLQDALGDHELDARVIPLMPAPLGFAANTLLFGGVFFGLFAARTLRTNRSCARRGICLRCGYDRSASPITGPCPECGLVVPERLRLSAAAAPGRGRSPRG